MTVTDLPRSLPKIDDGRSEMYEFYSSMNLRSLMLSWECKGGGYLMIIVVIKP